MQPGFRSDGIRNEQDRTPNQRTLGIGVFAGLRTTGYRLVEVHGHAQNGDLTILYVEIQRRQAQ